jgi:ribosomal protein S18 acetylase RimI-like enzyme
MEDTNRIGRSIVPVMLIREFHYPEDYDACVHIWKNAGPGIVFSHSDNAVEIENKLNYLPELFLVATSEESIIGTVIGGYDGRRGMVYHLAVVPDYQHRGIGRKLLVELQQRLKKLGCHKCYLMVTPENLANIEFYRKLGWEIMDVTVLGKVLA